MVEASGPVAGQPAGGAGRGRLADAPPASPAKRRRNACDSEAGPSSGTADSSGATTAPSVHPVAPAATVAPRAAPRAALRAPPRAASDGAARLEVGKCQFHFTTRPYNRPLGYGVSRATTDALGYTVPTIPVVTFMDASCLDDPDFIAKIQRVASGGEVHLKTGDVASARDVFNAQYLRKRFEEFVDPVPGSYAEYGRYGGRPAFHVIVRCKDINRVEQFHKVADEALTGLKLVDDKAVFVGKAHSGNSKIAATGADAFHKFTESRYVAIDRWRGERGERWRWRWWWCCWWW